jgi:hypothetical protein
MERSPLVLLGDRKAEDMCNSLDFLFIAFFTFITINLRRYGQS